MTDNEIIKALDICSKSTNGCSHSKYTCEDCYLHGQPMCSSVLLQDVIDYFNRQKATIERLKIECGNAQFAKYKADFEEVKAEIKAEVYKEFAERLKKRYSMIYTTSLWKVLCNEVDNILKEMVGEDNGNS